MNVREMLIVLVLNLATVFGGLTKWDQKLAEHARKPEPRDGDQPITYYDQFPKHQQYTGYKQLKSQRHCYTCMSPAYRKQWNTLMTFYYPPRNFTYVCDEPDMSPELAHTMTEPCNSACVTIMERLPPKNRNGPPGQMGYMRGCMSRFLMFANQPSLQREWAPIGQNDLCRLTQRHILHMRTPIIADGRPGERVDGQQDDIITMCSCTGDRCNRSIQSDTKTGSGRRIQCSTVLIFFILFSFLRPR